MVDHAFIIPLLPLAAAIVIFFFGRWLPLKGAWFGILAIALSLFLSVDLFLRYLDGSLKIPLEQSWSWFSVGIYPFEWGILLDGPSLTGAYRFDIYPASDTVLETMVTLNPRKAGVKIGWAPLTSMLKP